MLTTDKGKEDSVSPITLISAVIWGKLKIYTPLRYSESYSPVEATMSVLGYILSNWTGELHSFKTGGQTTFWGQNGVEFIFQSTGEH